MNSNGADDSVILVLKIALKQIQNLAAWCSVFITSGLKLLNIQLDCRLLEGIDSIHL